MILSTQHCTLPKGATGVEPATCRLEADNPVPSARMAGQGVVWEVCRSAIELRPRSVVRVSFHNASRTTKESVYLVVKEQKLAPSRTTFQVLSSQSSYEFLEPQTRGTLGTFSGQAEDGK